MREDDTSDGSTTDSTRATADGTPATADGATSTDGPGSAGTESVEDATGEAPASATDRRFEDVLSLLRRGARIALPVLVLLAVLPFVAFAVPQAAGADHSFVVLSGSMEPSISPGDVVLVAGVDPGTIEDGDVITFQRSEGDSPTTHRVIEVEDAGDDVQFRTKGDANEDPDQEAVHADQVIGRVTLTIPFIGHVITFVNTPTGFGLLVVTPLVAFVLSEAWAFRSRRQADDSNRSESTTDARFDATDGPSVDDIEGTEPGAEGRDGVSDHGRNGSPSRSTTAAPSRSTTATPPHSPTTSTASTSTDQFTLTKADLTFSLGILCVLVTYSGWTVYASYLRTGAPGLVPIMVCAGSATALVLGLAARSTLPDGSEPRSPRPTASRSPHPTADATTVDGTDTDAAGPDPARSVDGHANGVAESQSDRPDAGETSADERDDLAERWASDQTTARRNDAVLGDGPVSAEHGGGQDDE